jgi:hypothetical protein
MATQDSSSGRRTPGSYSTRRLVTPAAAAQTSVQSRQSRMHLTISARLCSPRSAALSAVQAWAQSFIASMAAASTSASTFTVRENVSSICRA